MSFQIGDNILDHSYEKPVRGVILAVGINGTAIVKYDAGGRHDGVSLKNLEITNSLKNNGEFSSYEKCIECERYDQVNKKGYCEHCESCSKGKDCDELPGSLKNDDGDFSKHADTCSDCKKGIDESQIYFLCKKGLALHDARGEQSRGARRSGGGDLSGASAANRRR